MKVRLQPVISPSLSSYSLLLLLPSSSYLFNAPSNIYRVYSQLHPSPPSSLVIFLTSSSLPPPSVLLPSLPPSSSSSLLPSSSLPPPSFSTLLSPSSHFPPSDFSCFFGLLGILSALSGARLTVVAPRSLAELFKTIHLMLGPRLKNVKLINTGDGGGKEEERERKEEEEGGRRRKEEEEGRREEQKREEEKRREEEAGRRTAMEGKVIYEDVLLRVRSWHDLCFFAEVKQNETLFDKNKLSKFDLTRSQISQLRERGEVITKAGRKILLKQLLLDVPPLSFLLLDLQTPQQLDLITKIGLPENVPCNFPWNVPLVVHFGDFIGRKTMFKTKKYQEFVVKSLKHAKHLVVGGVNRRERGWLMLEELAKRFPKYFNRPNDSLTADDLPSSSILQPISYSYLTSNSYWELGSLHYSQTKKKIISVDFPTSSSPSFHPSPPSSSSSLPSSRSHPLSPSSSSSNYCPPPFSLPPFSLLLLGTSSSIPTPFRSLSSHYLKVADCPGILLDIGEGSLQQMELLGKRREERREGEEEGGGKRSEEGEEGRVRRKEKAEEGVERRERRREVGGEGGERKEEGGKEGLRRREGGGKEGGEEDGGKEEIGKDVGLIFISHLHADHHLGLVEFLRKRVEKGWDEPLFVVMPYVIFNFVFEQLKVIGQVRNVEFVASDSISAFSHPFNKKNQMMFGSDDEEELVINSSSSFSPPFSSSHPPPHSSSHPTPLSSSRNPSSSSHFPPPSLPSPPLSSSHPPPPSFSHSPPPPPSFLKFLKKNDMTIQTIPSDHCQESYSIVIKYKEDFFKIVYSGDTRPYPPLIKYGRNCHILIHEATYVIPPSSFPPSPSSSRPPPSSSLPPSSSSFSSYPPPPSSFIKHIKHSTRKEAEDVGRKMNAWRTILTHFGEEEEEGRGGMEEGRRREGRGQNEIEGGSKDSIVIGCDGMRLNENNIGEAPQISREITRFYNKMRKEL